jgi:hypothetical protein
VVVFFNQVRPMSSCVLLALCIHFAPVKPILVVHINILLAEKWLTRERERKKLYCLLLPCFHLNCVDPSVSESFLTCSTASLFLMFDISGGRARQERGMKDYMSARERISGSESQGKCAREKEGGGSCESDQHLANECPPHR